MASSEPDAGSLIYPNVRKLDRFPLAGGPPNIEVPAYAVSYDMAGVQNEEFQDSAAFHTALLKEINDETKSLAEMVRICFGRV